MVKFAVVRALGLRLLHAPDRRGDADRSSRLASFVLGTSRIAPFRLGVVADLGLGADFNRNWQSGLGLRHLAAWARTPFNVRQLAADLGPALRLAFLDEVIRASHLIDFVCVLSGTSLAVKRNRPMPSHFGCVMARGLPSIFRSSLSQRI